MYAHPHVFIDNKTICVFDDDGLKGLKVEWTFDDMFGSSILLDYDVDGDHSFDQTEIDTIYAEAFSNLENYDYLYHIEINDESFIISEIDSFSVHYQDGKLIYSFFIPCRILADDTRTEVQIMVYDETYFIVVETDIKSGVSIKKSDTIVADVSFKNTIQVDDMYGELKRRTITLSFEKNFIFIDNKTTCIFDDKGLEGFMVEWTFDDMFGSSIMLNYDVNDDHSLDQTEINTIYSETFLDLKEQNFHYHITFNNKEYKITDVDSFSAKIVEDKLLYSFFIPCRILADNTRTEVQIVVYDETYFFDVETDIKNGVSVKNSDTINADVSFKNTIQMDDMYRLLGRKAITLSFKKWI